MNVAALLPAIVRGRPAWRPAPSAPAEPGAISGAIVGVSFIAGLAGAMARSEHPYPRPGSTGAEIRRYFTQPSRAPRTSTPVSPIRCGPTASCSWSNPSI